MVETSGSNRTTRASASPAPGVPESDLVHAFGVVGEQRWQQLAGARLFVTGGTGFVGKWLLATLLDADRRLQLSCEIVVLSRDPRAFAVAAPELARHARVTLVRGDVRDFGFPVGRFTHVVHAATDVTVHSEARDIFATCVDGTRRVLDFAAHAEASDFLLVSSGAVYGRQPPTLDRVSETHAGAPDPLLPSSAYGEGKRVSEWLGALQAADSSLRVKVARCFAFVGPYLPLDRHFAVGNFLRDAMADGDIVIRGDGTPRRSYMHAADMAAWLWVVLLRGRSGIAYNVGAEDAVSIEGLAYRILEVAGSKAAVSVGKQAPVNCLPERYVPDTVRARTEFGLAEPIPLDEALARTLRWHREMARAS